MNHPLRKGAEKDTDSPGLELLAAIRAGFIVQQTTMGEWCRQNGIVVQNARMAILGGWRGPKAKKLITKIKKAAGVQ